MQLQRLIDAINYKGVVSGLTHDSYRYPARFSPMFARCAIELFSRPGDTILDPFAGGGTSLVEGLALGRNAVGVDINQLAVFLCRTKTTLFDESELMHVRAWVETTAPHLTPVTPVDRHTDWYELGYQRNLPWRVRKIVEQGLNRAALLADRSRPLARLILLRTAQWSVDCRDKCPHMFEFRDRFQEMGAAVLDGFKLLAAKVEHATKSAPRVDVLHSSVEDLVAEHSELLKKKPARLVVTSPPYPEVHVLYHRWQVNSRRESPAPYWIANCHDGHGAGHYTFVARRNQRHDEIYFERLRNSFTAIRKVVADDAFIVQLVGFANPGEQLPLYLKAMKAAGFQEYEFGEQGGRPTDRSCWRSVPNRKWYSWAQGQSRASSEIMLVHRPA